MDSQKRNGGVGLTGILFIVFLVLKLTGNIDWSWWWVTSPLWIPIAFFFTILILVFLVFMTFLTLGFDVESIKEKMENLTNKIR